MVESGRSTADRVLQGTAQSISVTFYEDDAVVDPGTVTVGITRADGTSLVAPGTATTGSGATARSYALAAANTALLDILTAAWTSSTKGTLKTTVEIVGGFFFSLKELDDILSEGYTLQQKADARTLAESAFESATGRAFVPRYRRDTVSGAGLQGTLTTALTRVALPWQRIRAIRDVTVNGSAMSTDDRANLIIDGRFLYSQGGWAAGVRNITVGYEYGYDAPPPEVARAVKKLAKFWLGSSPVDERSLGIPSDTGIIPLASPGRNGAVFGIPDVDVAVAQHSAAQLVG